MAFTFDSKLLSDLYKDAYGFRPSMLFMNSWAAMADEQKQATWDELVVRVEEECERERRMQDLAHERWSAHLAQLMTDNGISYATALRWDMAAMDCGDDAGYYCYKWGISYSCESDIKIHMQEFI